jgi:hypothetical protein
VNREIRRIVDGVPDGRAQEFDWADPVGELDRRLDVVVGTVVEPDEPLVKAINQALSARQRAVVYRYGVRLLGRGINAVDSTVLPQAAVAMALACYDETDYRDLMVKLAPLHVAATRLHVKPAVPLGWLADRLPETQRPYLADWGDVDSIENLAYGWDMATTDDGIMFVPG